MKKTVIVFSFLIIALVLLFQISEYYVFSGSLKTEIAIAIIAVFFLSIGIFISKRSLAKKPTAINQINHKRIKELEITSREYEVLRAIAEGLTNKQIGDKLHISESTVKTHVSSLLLKLNAKRRTQALQIASKENLI